MKRTFATLALAAFLSLPAPAQGDTSGRFAVGGHASTLGYGLNMGYDFNDRAAVRGVYSRFDYDVDREVSGNDYKGSLDLESYGVLFDWFPWADRGFRVTGGFLTSKNGVTVGTAAEGFGVGGDTYSGAMALEVDYDIQFGHYMGVGWRSGKGRGEGLVFSVDAGVLFQSTPEVSASGLLSSAALGNCSFSLSNAGAASISGSQCNNFMVPNPEPPPEQVLNEPAQNALDNLEAEHRELEGDLDDYRLWPVVLLGVSYSF